MFDVRPVTRQGDLDFERIKKVTGTVSINLPKPRKSVMAAKFGKLVHDVRRPDVVSDEIRRFHRVLEEETGKKIHFPPKVQARRSGPKNVSVNYDIERDVPVFTRNIQEYHPAAVCEREYERAEEPKYEEAIPYAETEEEPYALPAEPPGYGIYLRDIFSSQYFDRSNAKGALVSFMGIACGVFLLVFGIGFFNKGMWVKKFVLQRSQEAYGNLAQAKEEFLDRNFEQSSVAFTQAHDRFNDISTQINDLGGVLVKISRFFPYVSKLSSGNYMAEAGKDLSGIGVLTGEIMAMLDGVKNPLQSEEGSVSFLRIFQNTSKNAEEILARLGSAIENLDKVNIDDVPEEHRSEFIKLKNTLPEARDFIASFLDDGRIFADVLGGNGPRKYLFLFQNNQEMRATGGFIGTYGILDIFEGRIRKFFIDGIFNPDGQLREKVVPPVPIQKISAAWSLHDSNWFPDFPTSAEKAIWFYEKTGGPTVDGVITMTPNVLKELLAITGPIEMPEYEVTIDENNFVEKVQYEVEVDYDKELNEPKKILSDLAPRILDKIFNAKNFSDIARTSQALMKNLSEKQILMYSRNYEIETRLSRLGWSGEVLRTNKDYISVINTNINGFKTDGVVEEKISHTAEIQPDGSIVDSVTISRHHKGGDTDYEWWNKVNADYMRVYVPKGSRLVSAEGNTREFNAPPLDYSALGFKRDPRLYAEEESMHIDEASGTRVYEDEDKTVFANWVYVSPKETATITYTYVLPFQISFSREKLSDSYSLLAQKQSGSAGSVLVSRITYPEEYASLWKYPDEISEVQEENSEYVKAIQWETLLEKDRFFGVAFMHKE